MQQNLYGMLKMAEIQKRAYETATPIQATFELTPRCNFNCRMCYVHLPVERIPQVGGGRELTADEWLEIGRQAAEMGVLSLCITGGDPLCYPEFRKVWTGLSQMGFQITLQTNASMINEEILNLLDAYPPETVKITLYGSNDQIYTDVCLIEKGFTRTDQGIRALQEHGHNIQLVTTFIQQNRRDADQIAAYAKEHNLPWYYSASCYPSLRGADSEARECAIPIWDEERIEETSELWNNMKPMPDDIPVKMCSGYRTAFNISWDGKMEFCLFLNKPDISVIGEKISQCWKKLLKYCENLRWPEECYYCSYNGECKRCLAHLACISGELQKIDKNYCRQIKQFIDIKKEKGEISDVSRNSDL